MSHTSKYASLQHFTPGTPEYVLAHAQWQKSRGRKPSLSFLGFKNPAQAFRIAQNLATLNNMMDSIAKFMPDDRAADYGAALFRAGEYKEAIPYLKQATEWFSDVEYPHMLGLAYARQKQPDYIASIEAFLTALHKPDATIYDEISGHVYKNLAEVLDIASGKPDAAVFAKRISAIRDKDPAAPAHFGLEEIHDELRSIIASRSVVGQNAARNEAYARIRVLASVP